MRAINLHRDAKLVPAVGLLLLCAACGGGSGSTASSSSGSGSGSSQATLTISPLSKNVIINGTLQFTANIPVSWSVNDVAGGNSKVGTISSAGLYTAFPRSFHAA